MSCMSGSPNLNSFRDRGQVAVQLVSCGVLLPGLVRRILRDICKIRRLKYVEFIEISRTLSSEICQVTAFRSRLKKNVNKNNSKTKGEERKKIQNHPESSKRYLLSSGSALDFACIEKVYKVKYKGLPG